MNQQQFGKYSIHEHLGSGAYADVFKAYDLTLKRFVALKLLKPELSREAETRQRFLNEAQALAQLEHPNIAWVYEIGQEGAQDYIAIRYIEGPSLDKYLKEKGTLSWKKALRITTDVARALQYSHERGMIHRNVKPGNIILGPDGAVLTDFGLVKSLDGRMILSQSGQQMIGSWWYMATEIIEEQPAVPASDQFSLACTLVEMLTGKSPFYASTPMAVMRKHDKPVEFPERWIQNVPAHINQVLKKALAKEPNDRYPDLNAFVKELSQSAPTEVKAEKPAISNTAVNLPSGSDDKGRHAPNGSADSATVLRKTPYGASAGTAAPQTQRAPVMEAAAVKKKSSSWLLWVGVGMIGIIIGIIVLISNLNPKETPPTTQVAEVVNTITRAVTETQPEPAATVTQKATTIPTQKPSATPTVTVAGATTKLREQDGMEMVYVLEGTFTMGSNDGDDDDPLVHEVYLDAYWIDKYEVTNGQYEQCVAAGECTTPRSVESSTRHIYYGNVEFGNYPVIYVDWYRAQTYCEWVGGSLPTEAQWEKAARGTDGRTYPWGNETANSSLVNYDVNVGDTSEVGSYSEGASLYGALDMAGNVWEWAADWYDENYYNSSPRENPTGPGSGTSRVLRGGSWSSFWGYMRAAVRVGNIPGNSSEYIGFRCAVSP